MNNSVFVTNNMKAVLDTPINKNNIFVWDAFILEMTKDSWHQYIDFCEAEAQENHTKFNLQKIIEELQQIKYIMIVSSYSLSNEKDKHIIFDEPVLENNLSQEAKIFLKKLYKINQTIQLFKSHN